MCQSPLDFLGRTTIKARKRPTYPSLGRQFAGLALSLAAIASYEIVSAFTDARSWGGLVLLGVILFVTYLSGLRAGLISVGFLLAWIAIGTLTPGSVLYGRENLEGRLFSTGLVFGILVLFLGVAQNKVRAAAERAYEAAEAAEKAETELLKSEGLRSTVVDAAMDAIVAIDAQGVVTLWNKSAETMFGWPSEETLGRPLAKLIVPEAYRAQHEAGLRRYRETKEGAIIGKRLEFAAINRDGNEFPVEVTIVPHEVSGETMFVGFLRDLSAQKRLQRELLEAQKLESVGQLAGGVAHDFNNVLSIIVGHTELAKRQLEAGNPVQQDLNQVLDAAERSTKITKQLLAFARKQVTEPRLVSLNDVVEGIRGMLGNLIKEDVELTFTPESDLWVVKADPGQLEQLLTNLVINARDAMPQGGRLMIETRNVSIEPDSALPVPDLEPGDYATLSVTDTGVGIPHHLLDRIFDPFFTTKDVEKGTGLGLASAYGIAKQAGGRISVYSEPGHGTMFRVYLPRAAGLAERLSPHGPGASVRSGNETVLVAEDNDQVRSVIVKTLEIYGYRVLSAASGEEAATIAQERGREIDLVVTDIVMPRGGGRDLAKKLRQIHPDIQVLFLSGYSEEAVANGGESIGGTFLQKPVLPTELAGRVRELLDARAASPKSSETPS